MKLNVEQKRINPDSTPSISKSFIDKSMSSNTDKSEDEDVFDNDGERIPKRLKVIKSQNVSTADSAGRIILLKKIVEPFKSPNEKPPPLKSRISFINRPTRPSIIVPSDGNSSDEEPRPPRKTFTGRKTIGGETSLDDDLEDIMARQIRKSMIQARFLKY